MHLKWEVRSTLQKVPRLAPHCRFATETCLKAFIDLAQFDQYCYNNVTILVKWSSVNQRINSLILQQYCHNIGQIELSQSAPHSSYMPSIVQLYFINIYEILTANCKKKYFSYTNNFFIHFLAISQLYWWNIVEILTAYSRCASALNVPTKIIHANTFRNVERTGSNMGVVTSNPEARTKLRDEMASKLIEKMSQTHIWL